MHDIQSRKGDLDVIVNNDMIQRQTISDQVYDHVRRLILSGVLKSGEKIPEIKIAEHLGVSRTPVREALRKLAEYGLVAIKPRSYAIVAAIGAKEAMDISLVRLWLEKLSFRSFARVASPSSFADLFKLSQECKAAGQSGDLASAHELDSAFHLEVARRTDNAELLNMLCTLDAKLQLLRLKQHLPADQLSLYFDQHEKLIHLTQLKQLQEIDALLEKHIVHDLAVSPVDGQAAS
jgi:GntR family transcriptional regulator, rspAB operon transcriptional repressor